MYRIATNEALSFVRRNSRLQGVPSEEVQDYLVENLTADPYFDGDEAELALQRALAGLPEKQRLVFNMRYFEAMKYDDISEILETSVGGLKASYHLAVKKVDLVIKVGKHSGNGTLFGEWGEKKVNILNII